MLTQHALQEPDLTNTLLEKMRDVVAVGQKKLAACTTDMQVRLVLNQYVGLAEKLKRVPGQDKDSLSKMEDSMKSDPKNLIQSRFHDDVMSQVIQDIVPRFLHDALHEETVGTPQALTERDAAAAMYTDRLAALRAAEHGLAFGRLDAADETDGSPGERRYIGRLGLLDEDHDYEPLLMDWRAPAAQPFYTATAASPSPACAVFCFFGGMFSTLVTRGTRRDARCVGRGAAQRVEVLLISMPIVSQVRTAATPPPTPRKRKSHEPRENRVYNSKCSRFALGRVSG